MCELIHTHDLLANHYCGRCDERGKLRDMKWQRGILLCQLCYDKMLLGTREPAIAAVLSDGKEELAPPELLRHPDDSLLNDMEFHFDI